ncbi:MAG: 4Fe-4S binding protein [candidate division Zixibacteria bacterium]|nr:4Fe-4S binding protein [candidate division Zixibacteria bacterium]
MSGVMNNRRRLLRRIVQLVVLFLLISPLFQFSFFSGTLISGTILGINMVDPLAAIDFILATKSVYLPVIIGAVVVLLFYFIIGGRSFCGWVCPMYLVSELIAKLPKSWRAFSYKPNHSSKFWLLGILLILSVITSQPVFEIVSPIGIISQNIAMGIDTPPKNTAYIEENIQSLNELGIKTSLLPNTEAEYVVLFNYSLWLLLSLVLIDIFITRGWWCRYTCPVGAFYTILGKYSPLKIKIDHDSCTNCGDCFTVCLPAEVLAAPVRGDTAWVNNSSCTNCLNCVDICPEKSLKFSIKMAKEKRR